MLSPESNQAYRSIQSVVNDVREGVLGIEEANQQVPSPTLLKIALRRLPVASINHREGTEPARGEGMLKIKGREPLPPDHERNLYGKGISFAEFSIKND